MFRPVLTVRTNHSKTTPAHVLCFAHNTQAGVLLWPVRARKIAAAVACAPLMPSGWLWVTSAVTFAISSVLSSVSNSQPAAAALQKVPVRRVDDGIRCYLGDVVADHQKRHAGSSLMWFFTFPAAPRSPDCPARHGRAGTAPSRLRLSLRPALCQTPAACQHSASPR